LVIDALQAKYATALSAVQTENQNPNIESILSRVRSLAGIIGKANVHGLDGEGYDGLSKAISCANTNSSAADGS
jgi:ppGpp synthetase/RelA/SpoT-type nucleotidyltranferase